MCLNILYEVLKVYRLSTFIISYTYRIFIYYNVRVCVCTSAQHYVGTPKSILIEKIINRHRTRIIGIGTHDRYYGTSLNGFMYTYLYIICINLIMLYTEWIRAFNVTKNLLLRRNLNACVNSKKKNYQFVVYHNF